MTENTVMSADDRQTPVEAVNRMDSAQPTTSIPRGAPEQKKSQL